MPVNLLARKNRYLDNNKRTNGASESLCSIEYGCVGGLGKNQTYPSSSSYVTYVTVAVNCLTCHKKIVWTMAPKKQRGVGAECTVSLHFLHPKDKIGEKIPNQTKAQKLSVLMVQERVEKHIQCKAMQCVVFRHEDFGG